eukprot:scaffold8991_cov155-Skeletonema_dohrnii-CCMP3373.AAC.3
MKSSELIDVNNMTNKKHNIAASKEHLFYHSRIDLKLKKIASLKEPSRTQASTLKTLPSMRFLNNVRSRYAGAYQCDHRACMQLGACHNFAILMFTVTCFNVSRDGLVGYDAALTRLRSGDWTQKEAVTLDVCISMLLIFATSYHEVGREEIYSTKFTAIRNYPRFCKRLQFNCAESTNAYQFNFVPWYEYYACRPASLVSNQQLISRHHQFSIQRKVS